MNHLDLSKLASDVSNSMGRFDPQKDLAIAKLARHRLGPGIIVIGDDNKPTPLHNAIVITAEDAEHRFEDLPSDLLERIHGDFEVMGLAHPDPKLFVTESGFMITRPGAAPLSMIGVARVVVGDPSRYTREAAREFPMFFAQQFLRGVTVEAEAELLEDSGVMALMPSMQAFMASAGVTSEELNNLIVQLGTEVIKAEMPNATIKEPQTLSPDMDFAGIGIAEFKGKHIAFVYSANDGKDGATLAHVTDGSYGLMFEPGNGPKEIDMPDAEYLDRFERDIGFRPARIYEVRNAVTVEQRGPATGMFSRNQTLWVSDDVKVEVSGSWAPKAPMDSFGYRNYVGIRAGIPDAAAYEEVKPLVK